MTQLPDRVLARRASLGDREAFGEIVDRHAPAMFRYAVTMLSDDAGAAEDAVQESLEKAWLHLPEFRGEAQLRTWLFRITANSVLAARRRRRPVAVDDHLLTALPDRPEYDPARQVVAADLWRALTLALDELPWRQREAWVLREFEQMSYAEIAHALETTTTVVRGQLHRARSTLAVRMEQWR